MRRLQLLLLRAFLAIVTHTLYRVRVVGRERIPATGAVLLTPNHVSFVDALFLLRTVGRPIRFLVDASYFHHPFLHPFMEALGCLPVSAGGGPRQILRALRDAGEHLDRGEVVCIFPEGQLTRTGLLLPFRRGMARIVKGRDAVVLPVHLDRVWGSIFSREGGRYLFKRPKRIPYPITVAFGHPLPADTPVGDVRRAVQDLGVEAWMERKPDRESLGRVALRALRRRGAELAMADATRPFVSGTDALVGAIAIARALRRDWAGQERVGVLLPPSVGGALVNVAAAVAGRTVVNLNYTAGAGGMASAARQAGLTTVVTSRAFLERGKIEPPPGVRLIPLEDLRTKIGAVAKASAWVLARCAPKAWIERSCGMERRPGMDDVATVIFSSGSTGEPKGVLLSHFNIDSNVEALAQAFRVEPTDRFLGILPLFHSFGTLTLWFSIAQSVPVVFHPSPLDAPAIGDLVERHHVTLLLATPTFLQLYMRRCTPGQFGSVRVVITGAEKLQPALADAFEDAFGVRPLEGYGATECAPVIAVSVPDFRAPGFFQPGSRRGSVGQPLPGVSVRVVHPDTGERLAIGERGMLLVRGPNVMRGYLGRDDLTQSALRDGWYVTGDIAFVDDDGFLHITDRLARFSKIGGEMVPHGRVEEALHAALGDAAPPGVQVFAVTGVPDERKGERLAVVHTLTDAQVDAALARLPAQGLPNLYLPRRQDFVRTAALPVLGTGKLDLRAVKKLAQDALGAPA